MNTSPLEADWHQEMFDFTPSPFSKKRSLNSTPGKMVLWDTSPSSSRSAGFLNKVAIPCPKNSFLDLLACCAASSMSLDLVTLGHPPLPALLCHFRQVPLPFRDVLSSSVKWESNASTSFIVFPLGIK